MRHFLILIYYAASHFLSIQQYKGLLKRKSGVQFVPKVLEVNVDILASQQCYKWMELLALV